MARVLVLDVVANEVREAQCDELNDFYRELKAEPFDIVRRPVGDKEYDIFVDDMGLWREELIVSAVNLFGNPMLVGNLIFANHNSEGETTDLTDEDVANILTHIFDIGERKVLLCNTFLT